MAPAELTVPLLPVARDVLFPRARLPLLVQQGPALGLLRDVIHAAEGRVGVVLRRPATGDRGAPTAVALHSPDDRDDAAAAPHPHTPAAELAAPASACPEPEAQAAAQPGPASLPRQRHRAPWHRTLCIARVLDYSELRDGGLTVVLEGQQRAECLAFSPADPYPLARVAPIFDRYDSLRPEELGRPFRELIRVGEALEPWLPVHQRIFRQVLHSYQHPSIVADLAAFHLVTAPYDRQGILETLDVGRRISLIRIQLAALLRRLSPNAIA